MLECVLFKTDHVGVYFYEHDKVDHMTLRRVSLYMDGILSIIKKSNSCTNEIDISLTLNNFKHMYFFELK